MYPCIIVLIVCSMISECGPMDIVFVLDSSDWLQPGWTDKQRDWTAMKNFAKYFVEKLAPVGSVADNHFAAITYGSDAIVEFKFNEHTSKDTIDDAIDKMKWQRSSSNMQDALW